MLSAALGIISSSTAAITAKTNSIASVRQRPRFKPSFFLSHFLNTPFESDAIEYLFTAAQIAGAELSLIRSEDVEDALVDFAKDKDANIIVLGAAGRPNGKEPLVMRLQRRLPEVEFDVVAARG